LGQRTPSVAQLGRYAQTAARRAACLLEVLDAVSRPRVRHAAGDELFVGRQPILMVVEPASLCWVGGRLAARRDGPTWAEELGRLPALEQLTRDDGTGLAKGLEAVNAARQRDGRPPVADQADHFHLLREGTRALRRLQGAAGRALQEAHRQQQALERCRRRGQNQSGPTAKAAWAWQRAEVAFDRWGVAERAWTRIRAALRPFTPQGELTTRARGEALVAEVLPALDGPEWAKARRQLRRREVWTFLDRTQAALAALPVAAAVREAAVQVEGLRRQPERLRGEAPPAQAARGWLLAAGLVLALGGAAGAQALGLVQGVLAGLNRASSLVEGLNSVLRMPQARHRRLTQGLLDLKRLYWNCRAFRTGRRRGKTPYALLGVALPASDWWDLLKLPPEQLRQQLSGAVVAI
jgi:hypothetical protein